MTEGDKGVTIVIDAGGFIMDGADCTLLAAPGTNANDLGIALRLRPVSVAADGLTASYTTTGKDFLRSGPWQVQLEVATQADQVLTSRPGPIYVYPLLET